MKKNKYNEKGITLIALIITIIVLIIVTSVIINATIGQQGVITRTKDARDENERTQVIENAQDDLLQIVIGNNGNDITNSQLQEVLEKYFKNVPNMSKMSMQEILNLDLKTKSQYGKHTIKVSEIYNGTIGITEIDWALAKENATQPHPSQTGNKDIGIGTDGNLVNLDLWNYGTRFLRYNENTENDEIIECASDECALYEINGSMEIIPRI